MRAAAGERIDDQRPRARLAAERLVGRLRQARLVSRYSGTVELSQLAKSAMKSEQREPQHVEVDRVGRVERQTVASPPDDPVPPAERFDDAVA